MNISQTNNINFNGVKLINPSFEHARTVKNILNMNGVNVFGHRTFFVNNDFVSKKEITDFIRLTNDFSDYESGIIFFPWSGETWILSNKSFEQKIKNILDKSHINSEINLGI